jgi:hypothetical protein
MSLLNINAFRSAALNSQPFDYLMVPNFVSPENCARIIADYPSIDRGGSFPLSSLSYGGVFAELCDELRGDELRQAFAEKFSMDLSQRPTTLTVRGRCRAKDGQIHVDSKSKLITVLLYLNGQWDSTGGRLRILNSPNIDDYADEVPPQEGTLLAFRNGPTAWHGHTSYEGIRRAMQLNWVTDEAAVRKSERRHGLSAFFKRMNPFHRAA